MENYEVINEAQTEEIVERAAEVTRKTGNPVATLVVTALASVGLYVTVRTAVKEVKHLVGKKKHHKKEKPAEEATTVELEVVEDEDDSE